MKYDVKNVERFVKKFKKLEVSEEGNTFPFNVDFYLEEQENELMIDWKNLEIWEQASILYKIAPIYERIMISRAKAYTENARKNDS